MNNFKTIFTTYVFLLSTSFTYAQIWSQRGSDIDGEATGDRSGWSVSLSSDGNTMAIGAYGNSSSKGHVRVYTWDGSSWSQRGSDIDGEAAGDQSGHSVSLSSDGNTLAIGAPNNSSFKGHVRVYTWDPCYGKSMKVYFRPSSFGSTNISSNGGSDGSILTRVTGGNEPYTYQWSVGSSSTAPNLSSLSAGLYKLEVTDLDGCESSPGPIYLSQP